MVGPPGWRICDQPSPIEMPKSSVMRLERSPEMATAVAGGMSPVFDQLTVGSDISSATQGSSVASVAGKSRAPTKQWAEALEKDSRTNKRPGANARGRLERQDMTNSPFSGWKNDSSGGDGAASSYALGGGPRGFAIE